MQTVVEVWENQRWIPGKGWGHFRLPTDRMSWSDKSGKLPLSREGMLLPPGWRWTGQWTVQSPSPKSEEGWLYAVDFTVPTRFCSVAAGVTSCVRRRCWVRSRTLETPKSRTGSALDDEENLSRRTSEMAAEEEREDDAPYGGSVSDPLPDMGMPRKCQQLATAKDVGPLMTSLSFHAEHAVHPREVVFYGFISQSSGLRAPASQADQHTGVNTFLPLVTSYFEQFASKAVRSAGGKLPELKLEREHLRTLYTHGIPQNLRSPMWLALSGSFERKRCCPGHYQELVAAIDPVEFWSEKHEVNVDVLRTFSQHPHFVNGYGTLSLALRRVLFALLAHAQMGYQQSFSYLGGLLLLNVDNEEDAFWLLIALVCDGGVLPSGYFTDHKVDADLMVTRKLVAAHQDRKLARHLESCHLDVSIFCNGWMQALLAAHVPPPTACRVLDVIFAEWSNSVVVRFVVAFLSLNSKRIMEIDDLGSLGQYANTWARALWNPDNVFRHIHDDNLASSVAAVRAKALADADQSPSRQSQGDSGA